MSFRCHFCRKYKRASRGHDAFDWSQFANAAFAKWALVVTLMSAAAQESVNRET
jgi:hypothetical protein